MLASVVHADVEKRSNFLALCFQIIINFCHFQELVQALLSSTSGLCCRKLVGTCLTYEAAGRVRNSRSKLGDHPISISETESSYTVLFDAVLVFICIENICKSLYFERQNRTGNFLNRWLALNSLAYEVNFYLLICIAQRTCIFLLFNA